MLIIGRHLHLLTLSRIKLLFPVSWFSIIIPDTRNSDFSNRQSHSLVSAVFNLSQYCPLRWRHHVLYILSLTRVPSCLLQCGQDGSHTLLLVQQTSARDHTETIRLPVTYSGPSLKGHSSHRNCHTYHDIYMYSSPS